MVLSSVQFRVKAEPFEDNYFFAPVADVTDFAKRRRGRIIIPTKLGIWKRRKAVQTVPREINRTAS